MDKLNPAYLAEIARQIGFISAFLGGVSATFMVALLAMDVQSRIARWAIVSAAASSISFIVAVVASTLLVVILHPDAPMGAANMTSLNKGRVLFFLGFTGGMYLLLACIGSAGWLRSRRMGQVTTSLATIGAALITLTIVN